MRLNSNHYRAGRIADAAGFTIVEVIMTFIIIGVLTLILVPVIANRAKEAKITAAQADMEHIADAEERAAVDTNYYYRLYALNDTKGGDYANVNARDDLSIAITGTADYQGILDNTLTNNNYYETPAQIFIYATGSAAGYYSTGYADLFRQLTLNETTFNWNGPYINWHLDANQNDWPDDPWGHDYVLFTRAGMIMPPERGLNGRAGRPDTTALFQTSITIGSFTYSNLQSYYDRPTLVSFGPDGLPGDGTNPNTAVNGDYPGRIGHGDDIVRTFGGS